MKHLLTVILSVGLSILAARALIVRSENKQDDLLRPAVAVEGQVNGLASQVTQFHDQVAGVMHNHKMHIDNLIGLFNAGYAQQRLSTEKLAILEKQLASLEQKVEALRVYVRDN